MLARLFQAGQAAVIKCYHERSQQCNTYPFDSTQPLADHSQGRVLKIDVKIILYKIVKNGGNGGEINFGYFQQKYLPLYLVLFC